MGVIRKESMPRLALSLVAIIAMALGLLLGAGAGKALADDTGSAPTAPVLTLGADEAYPLWAGET